MLKMHLNKGLWRNFPLGGTGKKVASVCLDGFQCVSFQVAELFQIQVQKPFIADGLVACGRLRLFALRLFRLPGFILNLCLQCSRPSDKVTEQKGKKGCTCYPSPYPRCKSIHHPTSIL